MGEIKATIELKNDRDIFLYEKGEMNESDVRGLTIEAMVDTGAVMLLLPQDMVEKLGLKIEGRVIVTLANDE